MNNWFKTIKKSWITIWLISAVICCSVLFTYAAYTRINIVKRVVSADAGAGARFSSDYMTAQNINMVTRKAFPTTSSDPLVPVHIFNYPYPKSALYRNVETEYSLTARIGTYDGSTFTALTGSALEGLSNDYYVTYKGTQKKFNTSDVATVNFSSCIIPEGRVAPDIFYVHFDSDELGDNPPEYYVEMVATPLDSSLPILRGYVAVRYAKLSDSGWTGELEELSNLKTYDAYNYILQGNGTGRITFKWDPTYLTINKQFLQNPEYTFYINGGEVNGSGSLSESSFPTGGDGMKSITLVVNSVQKNRYEVQFYKTDTSESSNYDYSNSAIKDYLPDSDAWVEAE